jgi:hypothetical protein
MALPTLLAGNVVLVKHSPNAQRNSFEFECIMLEAGFPEGVFQNLILKTEDIVNIINDPCPGSFRYRERASRFRNRLRGGKSNQEDHHGVRWLWRFIVSKNADIPKAVAAAITSRVQ